MIEAFLLCGLLSVGISGGVSIAGGVRVEPTPPDPIAVDTFQDFRDGTSGQFITDAALNSGKIGDGTWAIDGGATYQTWEVVTASAVTLRRPLSVDSQTITSTGTKWLRVDHDASHKVPSDAEYNGSGEYVVTGLTEGNTYTWLQGDNDDDCVNGGQTITSHNTDFDADGTSVTLHGTAGQPVTAQVRRAVEYVTMQTPGGAGGSFHSLEVGFMLRLNSAHADGPSGTLNNLDLCITYGNPFAVAQLQNGQGTGDGGRRFVAHSTSGTGGAIELAAGEQVYEVVLTRDDTGGECRVNVYDANNDYAQVGSEATISMANDGNAWWIQFPANYIDLGHMTGSYEIGGIWMRWE